LNPSSLFSAESAALRQVHERGIIHKDVTNVLVNYVVGYSALVQRADETTYADFERLKRDVPQEKQS